MVSDWIIFGIVPAVLVFLVLSLLLRKSRFDPVGPHLRDLPVRRLKFLLAGRFFVTASIGFLSDVALGGGMPRTVVIAVAIVFGAIGASILLMRRLPVGKRLLIIGPLAALTYGLAMFLFSRTEVPLPTAAANYRFDAFAITVTMMAGVVLFTLHVNTEGVRQLRAEKELELAHQLQKVLVPGVNFRNARLEVHGRSMPSEKVGGDLVDLISSGNNTLIYLLDVSGHGIPAGALMGSLKSAIRIVFPQPMPTMLDQLNRVLPSVKEPHMYATLGALAFEVGRENFEYALAGHLPILHCRGTGEVERLGYEQFPLGLFPGASYASRSASCAPGDLIVLYSDGIVEVVNAAAEQFGVDGLESEIRNRMSQPLEMICDGVMAASAAHGAADDDRSLLLIRVLS